VHEEKLDRTEMSMTRVTITIMVEIKNIREKYEKTKEKFN